MKDESQSAHEKDLLLEKYLVDLIVIALAWIFVVFFLKFVWRNKWEHRMQAREDEFQNRVDLYNRGEFSKKIGDTNTTESQFLINIVKKNQVDPESRLWLGSVGKYGSFICLTLQEKYRYNSEEKE